MQRFGGFLVDKGLISAGQLAEALLEQLKNTPPSIVILFENGNLAAQDVLDILGLQNEKSVDFRRACIDLKLWDDEFVKILQSEVLKKRPKLGQIVMEKGWVNPQELLADLKEYQSYCAENKVDGTQGLPLDTDSFAAGSDSKNSVSENVDSTEINAAEAVSSPVEAGLSTLESDYCPTFVAIETDSVPDYLDLFSEEKKSTLELSILSLETLRDENGLASNAYEILDSLFGDYHSLKGAARSVGAVLIEKLIHESEELLTFFKRFSAKVECRDFVNLSEINLSILDELWELRTELAESASEEAFWRVDTTRLRYLRLLASLGKMLQELQSRHYSISLDDESDMF